jgi:hypothetical protein
MTGVPVMMSMRSGRTARASNRLWAANRFATVALTATIMIGALVTTAETASADPTATPFATISESYDPASSDMLTAASPVAASYPNDVVRATQTGNSALEVLGGTTDTNSVLASGDVVWDPIGGYSPGDTPQLYVGSSDTNNAAFSASFYADPTAPTSYSGVATKGSNDDSSSLMPFVVPGYASYVVNVSVAGGAIRVSNESDEAGQTFEDAGQLSLGDLASGIHEVFVQPVEGAGVQWTISISPEPITIASQQFNRAWSQPGTTNTLHYSVDGDTHLTAEIESASGTVVRTLVSGLFEGAGAHTLVWDGRDSSGNPVPTGTYTAKLTSDDPVGNTTTATATIGIDSTPPTVSLAHTTLRPTQAVVVRFADSGSGVATGSITIDGAHKQVLRQGETTLSYGPRRWAPGRHQVVAVTTDRAGNRTVRTLSFRAKGNPTMPIRTGLTGPTRTRPGIVVLSVDGSGLLGGITGRHPTESTRGNPFGRLHWTTWNATQGRARGAEWINNCIPSCGQGVYRAFKATVHVYDPSSTGVFQRMTIATPSKRLRTYSALYADGAWGWN